jgi:hypothetical protein
MRHYKKKAYLDKVEGQQYYEYVFTIWDADQAQSKKVETLVTIASTLISQAGSHVTIW